MDESSPTVARDSLSPVLSCAWPEFRSQKLLLQGSYHGPWQWESLGSMDSAQTLEPRRFHLCVAESNHVLQREMLRC